MGLGSDRGLGIKAGAQRLGKGFGGMVTERIRVSKTIALGRVEAPCSYGLSIGSGSGLGSSYLYCI